MKVRGLPYSATAHDVALFFSGCDIKGGKAEGVHFLFNPQSGKVLYFNLVAFLVIILMAIRKCTKLLQCVLLKFSNVFFLFGVGEVTMTTSPWNLPHSHGPFLAISQQ